MYLLTLLAVTALSQNVAPAPAGSTPPQTQAPQQGRDIVVTGEKDPRDRKVCKTEGTTGSIMQKKTCRTVAEWAAITEKSIAFKERLLKDREARRLIQDMRDNPN